MLIAPTSAQPMSENIYPQHAGVLPSFAAKLIRKRLSCSFGKLEGDLLLAWRGPLPGAHRAQEIRDKFILGRRNVFHEIWPMQVGVHVVEGWERVVDPLFRQRLASFLDTLVSRDQFPTLSLQDIKDGLHMRLSAVLEGLAKMEALYWGAGEVQAVLAPSSDSAQPAVLQRVSEQWVLGVKIALRSGWIDSLAANDLRFESPANQPLGQWICKEIENAELPKNFIDLCDALVAADKCDWRTELNSVATHALRNSTRRPGSPAAAERWVSMFVHRYGGPRGTSLQEVGERFNVTRERVRQICDHVLEGIMSRPAMMPALDKLMAASARIAPMQFQEADQQLANLLGDGGGLEAALQFCEAIGRQTPAASIAVKTRSASGYEPVRLLQTGDDDLDWVNRALQFARKECRAVGCTNYLRVAGFLSLQEGKAVDADWLDGLFKGLPGFVQIEEAGGWFSLPSGEECAIAVRLRKLLSVATHDVGIDDLLTAISTDGRILVDKDWALTLPPVHVLAKLIASWTWLHADGHNKYRAKEPIKVDDVLSELELIAFRVMLDNQEVVTRTDLYAVLVSEHGLSNVALSFALSNSPIFAKVEHGVYRINGRQLSIDGLIAARKRRFMEVNTVAPVAVVDPNTPLKIEVRQTGSASSIPRRVVYLPAAYRDCITGKFIHARGIWPPINVTPGMQVTKLADVADSAGIQPREIFELEVHLASRTYDLQAVVQPA